MKQHEKFSHDWNHIHDHPNMEKETWSRQKRGIFLAIYNSVFGPTESQDVKQLIKNIAILRQNQNLQQSFIETNAQANIITQHPFS